MDTTFHFSSAEEIPELQKQGNIKKTKAHKKLS